MFMHPLILADIHKFQVLMSMAFQHRGSCLGATARVRALTWAGELAAYLPDDNSEGILRAALAGETKQ